MVAIKRKVAGVIFRSWGMKGTSQQDDLAATAPSIPQYAISPLHSVFIFPPKPQHVALTYLTLTIRETAHGW